jgi:hypothetical protein
MLDRQHPLARPALWRWPVPVQVVFCLCMALGCRERTPSESKEKFGPCTSLGQRCEFSPGKLGSCVIVEGCSQGNCFVCQSQH